MLSKIKSWGWVKTLGLVLGAIALAMAASRAQSLTTRARKKDEKAIDKLNSNISKELQAGRKLVESAHADKNKAVAIRKNMESQLEKLGEANEDMDAIANSFNSRRLRDNE